MTDADYLIIKDYNILTIKESQKFIKKKIIPAGHIRESIEKGLKSWSHFFYGNKKSFNCNKVAWKYPTTEVRRKEKKKPYI